LIIYIDVKLHLTFWPIGNIPRQQQPSAACNQARIDIVSALGTAGTTIPQIQDPTVQAAAAAGLSQARGGIIVIAQAIEVGAAPPAAGRDQVAAGLTAMGVALSTANL
jgi:hypothetical protein